MDGHGLALKKLNTSCLTPEPIDLITGAVRWLLIGSGR